jgi:hypothetical protein
MHDVWGVKVGGQEVKARNPWWGRTDGADARLVHARTITAGKLLH